MDKRSARVATPADGSLSSTVSTAIFTEKGSDRMRRSRNENVRPRVYNAEQLLILFERDSIHALRARLDSMDIEYRYSAVPQRLTVSADDLPENFRTKAETLFGANWTGKRRRPH